MEERLQPYETKMGKSYDALLKEYASIRAGESESARTGQDSCGLLWYADAAAAGRQYFSAGGEGDYDPALGEKDDP